MSHGDWGIAIWKLGQRMGGARALLVLAPLAAALLLAMVPGERVVAGEPPAPVELVEQRTATSKTFALGDGRVTTQLFTRPVHRREAGRWLPIDTRLTAAAPNESSLGYGWRMKSEGFNVLARRDAGNGVLRFDRSGRQLQLGLDGARPAPAQVDGSAVRYPNALDGVDLRYEMYPQGVKEQLVLRDASAPSRYTFTLTPPKGSTLRATRLENGGWAFRERRGGTPLFVLGAPFATDAPAGETRTGAATRRLARDQRDHATMDVTRDGADFKIELAVDPAWLADGARRFPVTVDPTIVLQPATKNAEFDARCGACEGYDWGAAWIGTDDYGTYRGAFQFDLSALPPGAAVSAASFSLSSQAGLCVYTNSENCGARSHTLDVHKMTKAWTPDVTTHSNLGWDATPAASHVLPTGDVDRTMTWGLTSVVQGWIAGTTPNHGLFVKRSTEPTDIGGPEVPSSTSEVAATKGPRLDVTYVSDAVRLYDIETVHGNGADLRWDKWEGAAGSTFSGYEIHRSATATFTPSALTRIASIADVNTTSYRDTTAAPSKAFTYVVVTNGQSSVTRTVTLPGDGQGRMVLQPAAERGAVAGISNAGGEDDCGNTGADPIMYVGNDYYQERGLLAFDLRDIPASSTIASATLSAYVSEPGWNPITIGAHRVTANWTEGTGVWGDCTGDGASWVERSPSTNWAARGGDFVATASATKAHTATDVPGWDAFDVTPIVSSWVSGTSANHGILLKPTVENPGANKTSYLAYHSDDYAAQPTLRPKLAVTYTEPGATVAGPTVQVASPAGGDKVAGTVTVEAAATDDRRVDKVEFLVDGVVKATDTTAPYTYAWDSKTATNASHTLAARGTDDAGNVRTSSNSTVTVANSAPPTTRVTSPSKVYDDLVKGDTPAAYWRLGEATGTAAADASGSARGGTYSGSYLLGQVGLLTGSTDKAVKLANGATDGRVSVTTLGGLLGTQLTAESWVSYAGVTTTGAYNRVLSRGWGSAGGWMLAVGKNTLGAQIAQMSVNSGGVVSSATANVTPGKLHLAGSYDGTTIRLYVNGAQVATQALSAATLTTTATAFVGETLDTDIVVDDPAVYARAVPAAALLAHFDVGSGRAPSVKGTPTVQAAAADDGSVSRVEFYVDGNRFGEDTTAPYSAPMPTQGAEPVYDGAHVLTTKAYDNHGQETVSANADVIVANASATRYLADFTSTLVPQAVTYTPGAATQESHGIDVTVTNRSTQTWSATDVEVRPRWLSPDPTVQQTVGTPVPLGTTLAPGASRTLRVLVEAPALPDGVDKAQYRLQVDLYEKSSASFFADKGNKPLENPVIVNKALLTALGLEKYYHYDGEELGAGMQHLLNVANGNSIARWTPFESPGRGLSTVLDITYNSLEKKSESPIGNNFSLSLSGLTRLGNPIDIHPNKADEIAGRSNRFVEITDGDGTTHRFIGKLHADGTVYWEEPDGVHLHLRSLPSTDPRGRWAFSRPDRVTFFYDADGFPTMVEDRNRNRLTYTLEDTPPGEDPGGPKKRVIAVTDAAGHGTTPAPRRKFNITYYSKADSKKAQVRGQVKRITDHTGSPLDFEYYDDGNLLRLIQRGGKNSDGSPLADRSFVFTYTTSNGDAPAIPLAADRVNPEPKTSNQSTRLYSIRDPRGSETTFTYLGPGHGQDRWKLASRTDRAGKTTSFAYDIVNRLTTVTAPLGRVWKYGYDVEGKVTSIVNAKNERTTVGWLNRHVTSVTNPRGKMQRFTYDDNGYLLNEHDELDRLTQLRYRNPAIDANDVAGKWKAGRTIPHISELTSKVTPKGKTWLFGYDERTNPQDRGNLTSVKDPELSVTQHDYNDDGTLSQTTDPLGRLTRYPRYDANGLAAEMVQEMDGVVTATPSAEDRVTQFFHDDDGLMRWVQDPMHRQYTDADDRDYRSYFDYDSFHRMGRQSAPKSTRFAPDRLIWTGAEFDANDNTVVKHGAHEAEDWSPALGSVAERTYDVMDRLTESTRPHARGAASDKIERTRIRYDDAGRQQLVTSPKGVKTTTDDTDFAMSYDFDPLDRPLRSKRTGDRGDGVQQTRTTHFCFDDVGDLRSVTAPRAQLATVTCGTDGAVVGTPYTSRITYTAAHEPHVKTDALGKSTSQTYDLDGNLETRTDQQGSVVRFEYNGRDQRTKTTTPFDGGTTPRNVVKRTEYDAAGNPKKSISPRAHDSGSTTDYVTTFEYNAADEVTRRVLPKNATTAQAYEHMQYDLNGRVIKQTLPATQATLAEVESAEPGSVRTQEHYDTGWLYWSKDENPKITYDYTAEGWQKERVPSDKNGNPNRERRSWTEYFEDGQPKVEYDRAGQPTEYTYDDNNNMLTALDKGVQDDTQKALKTTATYNGFDEVATTVLDQEGKDAQHAKFVHDPNGNVDERWDDRRVNTAGTTTKEWRRHDFEYDAADRVDIHTDFGRKAEATDDQRIDTDYYDTGWKKRRSIARHVNTALREAQTTDWTYWLNGQMRTLVTKSRPKDNDTWTTKESHDVTYHDGTVYLNGHRRQDTFKRDTPKADGKCKDTTCTQTFTYDGRDRLTSENNGAGTTRTYTLDAAGNVDKDEGGPGGTVTADHKGGQMLWQEMGGSRRYQHYDDWGNLDCAATSSDSNVCKGAQSSTPGSVTQDYTYDPNDNMLSFDDFEGHSSVDYVNDAFDRPVEEREKQGSDTPKSKLFAYIGMTSQVSDEEEFKTEKAGGSPAKTREYTYGPDGERVGMKYENKQGTAGPKDHGYGHDPQGSVSMLLDDAGKAQASYGYSAYGEPDEAFTQENDPDNAGGKIDQNKDALNPYRYTDKRWSPASKQLDMGARRFSPGLHSFIQDDRYENALDDMELSQDPLTQNRYSLAGGNPVSFVETDGHDFDPIGAVEDAAEDVGDAVSDAGEAIKDSADEALEVGKFVVGDDPLEIGLTVLTTVGTGGTGLIAKTAAKGAFKAGSKALAKKGGSALSKAPAMGRSSGFTARGSSAGRGCKVGNSFTGATVVLMADGSFKAIEDIEIGDRVRATDPETGKTANRPVEDVIAGFGIKRLVKVTAGGRTITATSGHPFWVESRGKWIAAEDLKVGDVLRDARGKLEPITALSVRELGDQRVYNLTVATTHTFHVGTERLLVHNCKDPKVLRDGEGATPQEMAASKGGPTGGSRSGQSSRREELLDESPDGVFRCWRCGQETRNPDNMHLGHRNVPKSKGGNLSKENTCLEGAACNLGAGNRGAPKKGRSCKERGSCGAPYGRTD